MAQSKRYIIDATADSAVVRCTRCDWRGYSHAKSSAYRQIASHLSLTHGEYKAASDARALAVRAVAGKLDSPTVTGRVAESES